VRENHNISVSCMPAYGEKYLEARYMWRDHLDHGAARSDFVLFGNGTMFIESTQLTDSDTYRCYVDLPDDISEVYTHSIIGKQCTSRRHAYLVFNIPFSSHHHNSNSFTPGSKLSSIDHFLQNLLAPSSDSLRRLASGSC